MLTRLGTHSSCASALTVLTRPLAGLSASRALPRSLPTASRSLSSTSPSSIAPTPKPAALTPAVATNAFDVAKIGSNQASLEAPRNGVEYALSTMDKVVNWARQGSMWPMVDRKSVV